MREDKGEHETSWADGSTPYARLVKLREMLGKSPPHEFVYFPEHNPVMPAYDDMLLVPADWRIHDETRKD